MYAIVEIAGKQFKVSKKQRLYAPKLPNETGVSLAFDKVFLVDDAQGTVSVGTPHLAGTSIVAKVLEHVKGDKVLVFKKKRRKGFKVKRGHRQDYTQLLIEDIIRK